MSARLTPLIIAAVERTCSDCPITARLMP
jgi:hypothetical protein